LKNNNVNDKVVYSADEIFLNKELLDNEIVEIYLKNNSVVNLKLMTNDIINYNTVGNDFIITYKNNSIIKLLSFLSTDYKSIEV